MTDKPFYEFPKMIYFPDKQEIVYDQDELDSYLKKGWSTHPVQHTEQEAIKLRIACLELEIEELRAKLKAAEIEAKAAQKASKEELAPPLAEWEKAQVEFNAAEPEEPVAEEKPAPKKPFRGNPNSPGAIYMKKLREQRKAARNAT